MTKIVFKNKNAVIIYKPPGIPSQSDLSGDPDALTLTSSLLATAGEPHELYLVHRLDRVVGGIMVLARNKKSAAALSALVSGEGIGKEYLAVVEGDPTSGELRDFLVKDARASVAKVVSEGTKGAKEAILEYETVATATTDRGKRSLLRVMLHTGRFHQIRAQLSSRSMPIVGDGKYGSRDRLTRMPALHAHRLAFDLLGEHVEALTPPDTSAYPWNLFPDEAYRG